MSSPSDAPALLLTVPDVCERLSLSRPTVYALINSGQLRSFLVGRARRIPASALDEYIARMAGVGGDPGAA